LRISGPRILGEVHVGKSVSKKTKKGEDHKGDSRGVKNYRWEREDRAPRQGRRGHRMLNTGKNVHGPGLEEPVEAKKTKS